MGDSAFLFFWVSVLVPVPQSRSSKFWFCSLAVTHSYYFFPALSSPPAEPQASNSLSTLLTSTAATNPSSEWTRASSLYKRPPLCSRGWSPRSKRENCRRRRILTRLISPTNKPCWRHTRRSRGEQRQSRFWSTGTFDWNFLVCEIKKRILYSGRRKKDCLWELTYDVIDWLVCSMFHSINGPFLLFFLLRPVAILAAMSAFSFPATSLCAGAQCNWIWFLCPEVIWYRDYLHEYTLTQLPGWVLDGSDSCLIVCKDDYSIVGRKLLQVASGPLPARLHILSKHELSLIRLWKSDPSMVAQQVLQSCRLYHFRQCRIWFRVLFAVGISSHAIWWPGLYSIRCWFEGRCDHGDDLYINSS